MRTFVFDVRGIPRPQGSMRVFPNGGASYPPAVWDWRRQVQQTVADERGDERLESAVEVRLGFDLPRPAMHYGTGRNAGTVKTSSPPHPTTAPDIDKLTRCVLDACTDAGLWRDDSQVVYLQSAKRYTDAVPGVKIVINTLEEP
jgi:Holliday junction resolvase RusA-like endonuclease